MNEVRTKVPSEEEKEMDVSNGWRRELQMD